MPPPLCPSLRSGTLRHSLGALLGSVMGDTTVIGLDFAFSSRLIVLLMGFWKGRQRASFSSQVPPLPSSPIDMFPAPGIIGSRALAGLAVCRLLPVTKGRRRNELDPKHAADDLAMAFATVLTRFGGLVLIRPCI